MSDRVVRLSVWLGLLAPPATLAAVLLATVLSPSFAWTENALSNLGAPTYEAATPLTRLVFNYGLIVGGFASLGFGYALFRTRRNRVEFAGIGLIGISIFNMALVGVFPQHRDLHVPVAVAFYTFLSLGLGVYGAGNYLAGDRRRAAATMALAAGHGLMWGLWLTTGAMVRSGVAIPEIVGAVLISGWAVATASEFRRRGIGDAEPGGNEAAQV